MPIDVELKISRKSTPKGMEKDKFFAKFLRERDLLKIKLQIKDWTRSKDMSSPDEILKYHFKTSQAGKTIADISLQEISSDNEIPIKQSEFKEISDDRVVLQIDNSGLKEEVKSLKNENEKLCGEIETLKETVMKLSAKLEEIKFDREEK